MVLFWDDLVARESDAVFSGKDKARERVNTLCLSRERNVGFAFLSISNDGRLHREVHSAEHHNESEQKSDPSRSHYFRHSSITALSSVTPLTLMDNPKCKFTFDFPSYDVNTSVNMSG